MAGKPRKADLDAYIPDELGVDEQDAIDKLGKLDIKDILRLAHKKQLVILLARLDANTITHQEMGILRNMLRDNGMVLGIVPDGQLNRPVPPQADLPEFEDPDYVN